MSFDRPIKTSSTPSGRFSPNPRMPSLKENAEDKSYRSSSPPLVPNTRSSYLRKQDGGDEFNRSFNKSFEDDDSRFRQIVFERFAEQPSRALITNREKFLKALSYAGFDLLKSTVEQLWSRNGQEITLKAFQRILNEEKSIDERAVSEALDSLYNKERIRDSNNLSTMIDYDKFRADLLEKGDRLTNDEFEKIRLLLGTEKGKVDARQLAKSIVKNKTNCREKLLAQKKEQEREEDRRPPSRSTSPGPQTNNVHIIVPPSTNKLSIPPKTNSLSMKGAFFCECLSSLPADTLFHSIGYSFKIENDTPIWLTVEANTSRYHKDMAFKQIDVRLLLFEKVPQSHELRLIQVSSNRTGNKSFLHLDELRRGSYEVVPITFGGVLRARSRDVNDRPPIKNLRETVKGGKKGNQNYVMSKDYREALEFVFDLFDFDGNKQLDRQEYNLWTIRTTGEEILNEDWISVREHINLDTDQNVSKDKFLALNDFEVNDPDTTEQTLWIGLTSLGFNYALELDMMCPFNLTIHTQNNSALRLKPTAYITLAEMKQTLIKFYQSKSDRIKLNNQSVVCYDYHDEYGSMLFVENKGTSDAKIAITVTNSKNAALTLPIDARKPIVINLKRNSSDFIWFAHKLDSQRAMELDATVRVQ